MCSLAIGEVSMSSRAGEPTIHDIARHLNVSATTVWRAINDRPRVSPETRERVLSEVKRLGYRPSLVAQTLSWGRTQTLGVVVPSIRNFVHAGLVRAVEQTAFENEFSIILCDTNFDPDRERHYFDLLIRRRVDGVLLIPFAKGTAADEAHLLRLVQAGVTVVCVQQFLPGAKFPQIVPDNLGAARDMTAHLIGLGHQRIAFLHHGLPSWYVSMNERLAGYRAALKEAGLSEDPELVIEIDSIESVLTDRGSDFRQDRVEALLRGKNRPTALFVPGDVLAIKVMSVARKSGLRVPEDVAVVGFDDIHISSFADPPLTTVRNPVDAVGQRAAELLFKRLGKNDNKKEVPLVQRVPCELVIRRSCGAHLQMAGQRRNQN